MYNKIKDAFDAVRAEDELKRNTKQFLSAYTAKAENPIRYKKVAVAFAALVLMLLSFGSWRSYVTPVSAISVDVNPSVELGVNRFDRVVAVDGYNEDGTELAASVDLKNLNYSDALEVLLGSEAMQPYVAEDGLVSITVIGSTRQKGEKMSNRIRSCGYAQSPNVECHSANREEAEAAHEAGMSFGKYRAFLELRNLAPEITANDIQTWTMRQIRDRINELSDGSNEQANRNGFGGGYGGGQNRKNN